MKSYALTKVSLCLFILILAGACNKSIQEGMGPIGKQGMVVTAHPEATNIGLSILRQGGNAVDAAVAVEFALAVCYPAAGNIAGGGFFVIRTSAKKVYTLDYREKAPLSATRDMYLGPDGQVVKGLSTQTILASGVPGTVDGMVKAHEKLGSLTWTAVIQPAIDLAKKGFPITRRQAADLNSIKKSILERNSWKPVFVKDSLWKEGDLLVQPELAATLERIRDQKRDGFYTGQTADYIVGQMQEYGGLITYKDLQDYQSAWREPIKGTYRNYEYFSIAPPSSGGVALKQLLGIISKFDIKSSGHNTVESIHYMVEAEKRVYADRAEYLGDPTFVSVPVEKLTDEKYLLKRASEIKPNKATPSDSVRAGSVGKSESLETTHFSIADRWGNAVSATTTLNGGYGNQIVVKGGGFFLNNEMDDFSSKPGTPNVYGLIGNEANAIEPGKRMLSCMTPTLVTKNGRLFMVVGSPGGSTIITSVFQTMLNVIDHGMTMQQAVTAKRFHHQWLPDLIQYEPSAIDTVSVSRLLGMGQHLKKIGNIGRVDAILIWPDGTMEGGADPRGDDTAKGF